MGNFFIKLFVKDYRNTSDPKVRERYGKFAGVVGIVSNLLLCMIKILAGVFSASIAIIADGINNLADASSSVMTLVGFRLASIPEDKDHPYGHARIEYLTGLFVSVLIIVLGLQLLHVLVVTIGRTIATESTRIDFGSATSFTPWLTVLLLFVLARVFQQGARMYDDLAGTV